MPTLAKMNQAQARFHELRAVFIEAGVRADGFSLPRQHALVHYVKSIKLFGSPNGVCSSITESMHIRAVKELWRRSNRSEPLEQILRTNTRLAKLAAARAEFGRRGMLYESVLTAVLHQLGMEDESRRPTQAALDARFLDERDAAAADGDPAMSCVALSARPGKLIPTMSYVHLFLLRHMLSDHQRVRCRSTTFPKPLRSQIFVRRSVAFSGINTTRMGS